MKIESKEFDLKEYLRSIKLNKQGIPTKIWEVGSHKVEPDCVKGLPVIKWPYDTFPFGAVIALRDGTHIVTWVTGCSDFMGHKFVYTSCGRLRFNDFEAIYDLNFGYAEAMLKIGSFK